jgi:putative restriction endonuclease
MLFGANLGGNFTFSVFALSYVQYVHLVLSEPDRSSSMTCTSGTTGLTFREVMLQNVNLTGYVSEKATILSIGTRIAMARSNWSRDELIIAFNLYCRIPFGRIHIRNPEVLQAAKIIGRSPSAVAWKLANFASLDPSLKARNLKGASHASNLDKEIWNEFNNDWTRLVLESERLVALKAGCKPTQNEDISFPEGNNRSAVTEIRIGQSFFRAAVLASYGGRCCLTGLPVASLLTASHIIPWSIDKANRTNPRNGLCLNALHDRAFDCGLLTVTPEYRVRVSPVVTCLGDDSVCTLMLAYDGKPIRLPERFWPDKTFLEYHNRNIFQNA